jgi:putative Holliday junction resolvase
MGRILAIDYGRKRVGIAVTDDSQIIASALATIPASEVIAFLKKYMTAEKVVCFVVGEPLQMNNLPSESFKFIEPFIRKLKQEFPEIPVERVNERFTSKMAVQTMIDSGLKKKDRQNKGLIDRISATIILQSYLDYRSHLKNRKTGE